MTRERDAAQAITGALWRKMLERGPGTIKRTEQKMGVVPDTLRNARNYRAGLRLKHVTEAIKALGIPPSVFFNDAIGGVSTTAAERFLSRGAELAARKLVDLPTLADETKPDRLTEDDLARLDAARFEDPRAAAEQAAGIARQAARDGRRGDAAAAVARQGSALRVAEMWEPAWVCVWWALEHAPNGPIRANAWLRSGSIVSDFGEFDDAAELAHSAMVASAECADFAGIGPALASHGMFLRRAERHGEAIPILRAALVALASPAPANRFAVHQSLAMAYLSQGEITLSESFASKAEQIPGLPESYSSRSRWLRARIAVSRQNYDLAVNLFRATLEGLEESPGDATLASAELCRTLLLSGHSADAINLAHSMAPLAMHQRQNRVIGSAILDLFRSAQKGALSVRLTERVISQVRTGLSRPASTSPRS